MFGRIGSAPSVNEPLLPLAKGISEFGFAEPIEAPHVVGDVLEVQRHHLVAEQGGRRGVVGWFGCAPGERGSDQLLARRLSVAQIVSGDSA
jgi:hypothetical protein